MDSPRERHVHVRPGVGITAHVMQGCELKILSLRVERAAMILVERGIKSIRTERGSWTKAVPGQAFVLGGNQTVDFINSVHDAGNYEARWLVFDPVLLGDAYYLEKSARIASRHKHPLSAHLISSVSTNLADAFDRAGQALASRDEIPDSVARQRVLEVVHWLLEDGIYLRGSPADTSVSYKIRALISGNLDDAWTADRVAAELALSEATLRRRLVAEGVSLTELLVDTRMSTALTLLQATTQPVSEIALSVGYESASRFAIRFKKRFGFSPTAVRGHDRAGERSHSSSII